MSWSFLCSASSISMRGDVYKYWHNIKHDIPLQAKLFKLHVWCRSFPHEMYYYSGNGGPKWQPVDREQ
jgi:hypothetical protein